MKNIRAGILSALLIIMSMMPVFAESADAAEGSAETEFNAVYEEDMTEEMVDSGWIVSDGIAYPPEVLEQEAAYQDLEIEEYYENLNLVPVTFHVDVSSDIDVPVYLFYTNAGDYQEYYIDFYASSGYKKTILMEPGSYYFTGGGPDNNSFSVYTVIDPIYFVIKKGTRVVINPVIRSQGSLVQNMTEKDPAEVVSGSEEPAESPVIAEEETSHTPWYIYAAVAACFLFGMAAVLFVYLRYASKQS